VWTTFDLVNHPITAVSRGCCSEGSTVSWYVLVFADWQKLIYIKHKDTRGKNSYESGTTSAPIPGESIVALSCLDKQENRENKRPGYTTAGRPQHEENAGEKTITIYIACSLLGHTMNLFGWAWNLSLKVFALKNPEDNEENVTSWEVQRRENERCDV